MTRYGNIEYVLSLSIKRAYDLFNKALKEIERDRTYQLWLSIVPTYTRENAESFEEYYDRTHPQKVELDKRSKDEIMNEILGKEG